MTNADLAAWKQVCEAATPLCACRLVLYTTTVAGDSTSVPKSQPVLGGNYSLTKCEFHDLFSPTVVLRLLEVVEAAHRHTDLNRPPQNRGDEFFKLKDALAALAQETP